MRCVLLYVCGGGRNLRVRARAADGSAGERPWCKTSVVVRRVKREDERSADSSVHATTRRDDGSRMMTRGSVPTSARSSGDIIDIIEV